MNSTIIIISSLLILAACIFDIKTKRLPNAFILLTFFGSLSAAIYYNFSIYIILAIFAVGIALLPLYYFRVLGGGDYKFFIALSPLLGITSSFHVFLYSLYWAACFGLIKLVLSAPSQLWIHQLLSKDSFESKKIPYMFAYLLGWMTYLRLSGGLPW